MTAESVGGWVDGPSVRERTLTVCKALVGDAALMTTRLFRNELHPRRCRPVLTAAVMIGAAVWLVTACGSGGESRALGDELAPAVTVVAPEDEVLASTVVAEDELAPAVTVVAEESDDEVLAVTVEAVPPGPCLSAQSGLLAGLNVVDATDTTLTIEYEPPSQPVSVFLDGQPYGATAPGTNQFVIERLIPGNEYRVSAVVGAETIEQGSTECGVTLGVATDRAPIGVVMPVGLAVSPVDDSSVMLSWVAPESPGDGYILYRGSVELGSNVPTVVDEGVLPFEQTSVVFDDVIPGDKVVIGIRTVRGDNQSSLAWVEVG